MQLTPYSTAVLILHCLFRNLCLDVSSSRGQNVVASHDGISFCDGNTCVPGDAAVGFWCISYTSGWRRVKWPEFGHSHCPHPCSLPQCVCHCCPVPKACLSQTFSVVEMFTIHIKGEKWQGHCLKSEVQSKGRAPLLVKLWSILEKSVCLISFT